MRAWMKLCLVLAGLMMVGMAAKPDQAKMMEDKSSADEVEDLAVIAELDHLEEQAIVEEYELLQSLEMLQDTSLDKPDDAQEEE